MTAQPSKVSKVVVLVSTTTSPPRTPPCTPVLEECESQDECSTPDSTASPDMRNAPLEVVFFHCWSSPKKVSTCHNIALAYHIMQMYERLPNKILVLAMRLNYDVEFLSEEFTAFAVGLAYDRHHQLQVVYNYSAIVAVFPVDTIRALWAEGIPGCKYALDSSTPVRSNGPLLYKLDDMMPADPTYEPDFDQCLEPLILRGDQVSCFTSQHKCVLFSRPWGDIIACLRPLYNPAYMKPEYPNIL